MPSKSKKQQRLMGAALAFKRGQAPHASAAIRKVAASMTESQLHDFAKKVKKKK